MQGIFQKQEGLKKKKKNKKRLSPQSCLRGEQTSFPYMNCTASLFFQIEFKFCFKGID